MIRILSVDDHVLVREGIAALIANQADLEVVAMDARRVAILGAGNLGLALADYPGFRLEGFAIVALFDTERTKIGRRSKGGVRIENIETFRKIAKRDKIDIAVIAVPAESAQSVVNTAVQAGIRGILNFSPGNLKVPPGVKLKNVDLTVSLESLSFFLARGEADDDVH